MPDRRHQHPLGAEQPYKEPNAGVRQAASGMKEMFNALQEQGFTEYQALVIIGQMLGAAGRGN